MPYGFESPLKIYPCNNELGAEIDFVEKSKLCRWWNHHSWRTVERWKFPYGKPRPTTMICRKCGALRRLLVSADQEGEVTGSEWVILGTVTEKWRNYDPYSSDETKERI